MQNVSLDSAMESINQIDSRIESLEYKKYREYAALIPALNASLASWREAFQGLPCFNGKIGLCDNTNIDPKHTLFQLEIEGENLKAHVRYYGRYEEVFYDITIPLRYLAENGAETIQAEAQALRAQEAEKALKRKEQLELNEKELFLSLQAKYSQNQEGSK